MIGRVIFAALVLMFLGSFSTSSGLTRARCRARNAFEQSCRN